jgi:hypothetical protein
MPMSYRIVFVLATGLLFASASWSDNDYLSDSFPVVFIPQRPIVISPPDAPLNDDCSRAIPLQSGVPVSGHQDGYMYSNLWYSFTPNRNGTLQISIIPGDLDLHMGLVVIEDCDEPSPETSAYSYGDPFDYFQEVEQGRSYVMDIVVNSQDPEYFSIQADLIPPGIPGDMCIEALEMAPNSVVRGSTVGATCFTKNSECDSYGDVWYTFAPPVEGCVRFSNIAEEDSHVSLALYDSCGGKVMGNTEQDDIFFADIPPGSDCRLRVSQDPAVSDSFVFETRIVSAIPVYGRIVDKVSGEGLSGVTLHLWGEYYYNQEHLWSMTTDSGGYFAMPHNLPEGQYGIYADDFGAYRLGVLDGRMTLTEGMSPLILEMAPPAHLEVICIDAETGEPVAEAMTIYTGAESGPPHENLLAPSGWVQIFVDPNDSASRQPSREEWVYLKSGENRSLLMPIKKGVPIRGTIRYPNGILHIDPCSVTMIGENGCYETYTEYASNGTFEFLIPPGTYGCWVTSCCMGGCVDSPWQQITVSENPQLNPDLELFADSPHGDLKRIHCTTANFGSIPHASPLEFLALPKGVVPNPDNIFTLLKRWSYSWDDLPDIKLLEDLPQGEYDLFFGIFNQREPIFSFTVRDKKLGVPAGTENLEFSYTSEGGTVMGMVLDPEGMPILVSEIVLNKLSGGEFAGWAKTNPRGQFVFYHVPAGTYTLSAVHRNYMMAQTTVTVPEGPSIVTAETLTMSPRGRREGADFDGDGIVDLDDLSNLTTDWMQDGGHTADLDGSGVVDMVDLARMGQTWLGQAVWLNRPAQFPEYPSGLIGQWTLDEQVDLRTVLDWSGNGRHGRAQQNLSARIQEGMVDLSLRFDGTGDYIDCGTVEGLQRTAWTVCAWVKCADTATPTLLSFGGNYPAVKLQQNGKGRPIVYLGNTNYRYFSASAWTTLKDGLWHHVAFSVPGNDQAAVEQAVMYLDGAAVAESTTMATGPQADKSRLYIGINSKAGQQRFKGAMDEVLLFDRVLSAGEIEKLYRSSR